MSATAGQKILSRNHELKDKLHQLEDYHVQKQVFLSNRPSCGRKAQFDQKTMPLLKEVEALITEAANCVDNVAIAIHESISKLSKDIDTKKVEV